MSMLRNISDFHINTYHTLFARVGPSMTNNAIYRVQFDSKGELQLLPIGWDA